jgi:hypothetical protein
MVKVYMNIQSWIMNYKKKIKPKVNPNNNTNKTNKNKNVEL